MRTIRHLEAPFTRSHGFPAAKLATTNACPLFTKIPNGLACLRPVVAAAARPPSGLPPCVAHTPIWAITISGHANGPMHTGSLAAQLRAEPPTGCPCAVRRLRCPPCPPASVPPAASAGTVRPFTVLDLPTANHASALPPLDASMTRGFPLARPAYRLATVRAPRHPHPQARCEHCKAGTRSWTAAGISGASRDKAAPAPETALPVGTCCAGGIQSSPDSFARLAVAR